GVKRFGLRIGADRRDVDEALHAGRFRRLGDHFGSAGMHVAESLGTRLVEDADQVHHGVRAGDGGGDGAVHPHIRLPGHDLADAAERLQEIRFLWTAHGDADTRAGLSEALDQIATDEPGATEYGDQTTLHFFTRN